MLDKTFNPKDVEARISALWRESGAFRPSRPGAEPFCVVIPPPNVTGRLHIGHALNNTLQDILVRFERLRGKDVLWQPGTDHAGIATQLIVERQLAERQMSRIGLGREKFLEEVWKWKAESGGAIVEQQHRLGASADWSRERFTMDEGLSRAVTKVFVELFRQKLIYKDKRLVNWDPRLETAVSDLEVESIELKGHLWHIKYPIEDSSQFIIVATTRPETMFGDTAVAVHPDDARYKDLVGREVMIPLTGRKIPIIADEFSDPEKGTGAVKITPGHDFNDFEVGKRHKLPLINILNRNGTLNDEVPAPYRGLKVQIARLKVVADLEGAGLIDKIDAITHTVPHDEKTKTVVLEPFLTEQWYLNVQPLADKAIVAVEQGKTKFVPENWTGVYFSWMRNIRPWCISRQLWWGHQIPVWYDADGKIYCAETEEEAKAQAGGKRLIRDDDVLDTWFSSALWPFSTLGWPDKTPELSRFYPTSVLVTGFDIIFFWVARMMMMGIHFMGEVPFRTVAIHGLVRDERGQKMAKSKGNTIDPLAMIDQYGADALRMAVCQLTGPGRDIKLSPPRIAEGRNFVTKLWNAARFCEMNEVAPNPLFRPETARLPLCRWLLDAANTAIAEADEALEAFRFDDYAGACTRFTWNFFCDWFLELAKPTLVGADEVAAREVRDTAAYVLGLILRLLHPAVPFVTESIWDGFGYGPALSLVRAPWPERHTVHDAAAAREELDWVVRFITAVRTVRSEMNVPPSVLGPVLLRDAAPETLARAHRWAEPARRLARISEIGVAPAETPAECAQLVLDEATLLLPLAGLIDVAAERARLAREAGRALDDAEKVARKLANEDFVARAPAEIIAENRAREAAARAEAARLAAALARLEE